MKLEHEQKDILSFLNATGYSLEFQTAILRNCIAVLEQSKAMDKHPRRVDG
jgi:hypothetical protein